ncbi:hypothetical protein D3C75_1305170 [compost metagenome]
MQHLMAQSLATGKARIHSRSITAQHRILVDQRRQDRLHMPGIQLLQLEIGQMAFPVLHHNHRDVIRSRSSGSPFATSLSGWS